MQLEILTVMQYIPLCPKWIRTFRGVLISWNYTLLHNPYPVLHVSQTVSHFSARVGLHVCMFASVAVRHPSNAQLCAWVVSNTSLTVDNCLPCVSLLIIGCTLLFHSSSLLPPSLPPSLSPSFPPSFSPSLPSTFPLSPSPSFLPSLHLFRKQSDR